MTESITTRRTVTVTTPEGTFRVRAVDAVAEPEDNPRRFDGTIGIMVLRHSTIDVPNEGELGEDIDSVLMDREYGETFAERLTMLTGWLKIEHGARVVLPVYGYSHGDFRMKAGERTHPFDDAFDSGVLGVVYDDPGHDHGDMTPEQIAEELAAEVATYDQWASNDVYSWVIERPVDGGWEEIDTDFPGIYYSEQAALDDGLLRVPGYTPAAVTPEPLPLGTVISSRSVKDVDVAVRELARARGWQPGETDAGDAQAAMAWLEDSVADLGYTFARDEDGVHLRRAQDTE